MSEKSRPHCRARTTTGARCKRRSKSGQGGFCPIHFRQAQSGSRNPADPSYTYVPVTPGKSLFIPIGQKSRLNKRFELIRHWRHQEPAAWMVDDVYQDFVDADGNFAEQFQTTGFDSRYFELYLHAYFSRSGYEIDRTHANPDFLVSKNNVRVAVEATTVNPPASGVLADVGRTINDLSPEELADYRMNELPIRFGSPLFSKLKKKYWELQHCQGLPFAIAIEAFHDENSLGMTDSALTRYVYGTEQAASWTAFGKLEVETSAVETHTVGGKVIPSNFFGQPGAENISAVIFTNSGTNAKFGRMGYQHGIGNDTIEMTRRGFCFESDPDAMDPSFFSFNLDEPPVVETWGQGLVVLHNPSCKHSIPRDFFVDSVQGFINEDGKFVTEHRAWHPMASQTVISYTGALKAKLAKHVPPRMPGFYINAISRTEFQSAFGQSPAAAFLVEEQGWYSDVSGSFLGVVFLDKTDRDWGWALLGRDKHFVFRAIEVGSDLASRDEARLAIQIEMAKYLSSPRRIFAQD